MLHEMLNEKLIQTDVNVGSWREAAYAVGSLLIKENKILPDYIDSVIAVVEELGPYIVLLPEIAFFHGKPSESVLEISIALITLKEPVYFSEFENQKITCAFCLAAKDSESHLELLMAVSQLFQDEDFLYKIRNNASKEELLACIQKY